MKMLRGAWAASTWLLAAASCSEDTLASKSHRVGEEVDFDAGTRDTERHARDSGGDMGAAGAGHKVQDAGVAKAHAADAQAPAMKPKVAANEAEAKSTEERPSMPVTMSGHPAAESDDDAGVVVKPTDHSQEPATLVDLGERLFQDRSLSLTGTQACASCHAAEQAFTGSADHDNPHAPVSRGAVGNLLGTRNAPTAMYAQYSPPLAFLPDPDEPGAFTPTGGLFWDGRVNSLSEQAAAPFINPREMALPDAKAVIERVQKASYVWMFEPLFGPDPLSDVQEAYRHVTDAIAAFERTPQFHPFSSKFDAFLRGQATLSEQEQHGFELFKDPQKANCIACHVGDVMSHDPTAWLFTDFTYDNLGVPRNMQIADNADAKYFDLGLCQSAVVLDKIPAAIPDKVAFLQTLCGAFKVPTLRNIANTAPYMHNGYFAKLRDVVDFYVTRDTDPARWYPSAPDGTVQKFNDLPQEYWGNVNTKEVPYDRKPGEMPRLTPEEIDAVVAFLSTLSDGYENQSR